MHSKDHTVDSVHAISRQLASCHWCKRYIGYKAYSPYWLFALTVIKGFNKIQQSFSYEKKPTYSVLFLWSKNFKPVGRGSKVERLVLNASQPIAPLFKMASTNWRNTMINLMRNQHMSLQYVSSFCLVNFSYYSWFNVVLHPYYKLDYIKVAWGGQD